MFICVTRNNKSRIFYGWFVLAGALLIATIGYAMRYSFSVFYAEILNEFGWSRADTAVAFSINFLVYGISSPVVGTLTDRFGPKAILLFGASVLAAGLLAMSQMNNIWLFYFLFGIVIAIGINSLGFAVHYAYLPAWFVRRRGLAFGLLAAAVGAGQILVGFYQPLISSLGWRLTYVVLAVIVIFTVMPIAIFLIRRTPQEMGLLPDGANDRKEGSSAVKKDTDFFIVDREWASTDWTLAKALRTHRFWFMFLSFLCYSMALNLVLAHQPIYFQGIGFSVAFAASIFSLTGFIMMIGSSCGFISDKIGREATYTLGAIGITIAVGVLMLVAPPRPWLAYLYTMFWGLSSGILGSMLFSSAADLFSGKHFGSINGLCILGFGIGGAIGPFLGGYIFDVMGSYTLAFWIAIAAHGLACIFVWTAAPRRVRLVAGKAPRLIKG